MKNMQNKENVHDEGWKHGLDCCSCGKNTSNTIPNYNIVQHCTKLHMHIYRGLKGLTDWTGLTDIRGLKEWQEMHEERAKKRERTG